MGSTAYPVVGFKQFPIAATDSVTINGKPFGADTRKALLKSFVTKLLGPAAHDWVFPAPGKINGILKALIDDGVPEANGMNGPARLLFDAAVWTWAAPSNLDAAAAYAHYQAKMESCVLYAADLSYSLRTVLLAGSMVGADELKTTFERIVRTNYPFGLHLRIALNDLKINPGSLDAPLLLMARDL